MNQIFYSWNCRMFQQGLNLEQSAFWKFLYTLISNNKKTLFNIKHLYFFNRGNKVFVKKLMRVINNTNFVQVIKLLCVIDIVNTKFRWFHCTTFFRCIIWKEKSYIYIYIYIHTYTHNTRWWQKFGYLIHQLDQFGPF